MTSAPIAAPDADPGSDILDPKVQRFRQMVMEQQRQEERLQGAQPKAIDPKPSMPDTVLGKRKEGGYIINLFGF